MRAVLLCNGEAPSEAMLSQALSEADLVVCIDGAADVLAKYGGRAHALVGDFDSLGEARALQLAQLWRCEVLRLNESKDKTDTQVAAEFAIEKGAKELIFLGALGKRFDHAFANVSLLTHCARLGASGVIRDQYCEVRVCCRTLVLPGKPGDLLSILPLGVNVRIRATDGLAYPLYDFDMLLGDSRGVSNVFEADEALVDVADGWVCVVHAWDTPRQLF